MQGLLDERAGVESNGGLTEVLSDQNRSRSGLRIEPSPEGGIAPPE
jgi:hypothetical protein